MIKLKNREQEENVNFPCWDLVPNGKNSRTTQIVSANNNRTSNLILYQIVYQCENRFLMLFSFLFFKVLSMFCSIIKKNFRMILSMEINNHHPHFQLY